MKKIVRNSFLIFSVIILTGNIVFSQDKKDTSSSLESETLKKASQNLDKQIAKFSNKIKDVVSQYDLVNADVKIVPFQFNYEYDKKNKALVMTRHYFVRDELGREIIGLKKKTLKIYTDGKDVSKFESEIYYVNYKESYQELVLINDSSPTKEGGSAEMEFTYLTNKNKMADYDKLVESVEKYPQAKKEFPGLNLILKNKKMSAMKNDTAFPIVNDIKNDFYIPHLMYFYDAALTIGESYKKTQKDGEVLMSDYLEEATKY